MTDKLLYTLFGGAVVLLLLLPRLGDEDTLYRNVIVPVKVIERREPDTVLRWRDRIVERTVAPQAVATAPGGAQPTVDAFCAADTVYGTDTVIVVRDPVALIRSGTLEQRRFFRPDRLILTGPLSNGDLRQWNYVTRGNLSFVANGDSVIVRDARWGLIGDVLEAGLYVGIGFLLGR